MSLLCGKNTDIAILPTFVDHQLAEAESWPASFSGATRRTNNSARSAARF
jgi:hypothetical protein